MNKGLLLCCGLVFLFAAPVWAGCNVYLKDGGHITARSAWRAQGKVQVLVNRETLTAFNPEEIDMRRTFRGSNCKQRRKVPMKKKVVASHKPKTGASPNSSAEPAVLSPVDSRKGWTDSLPSLPSMPQRDPSVFNGKEEGAIRKHKREMAERSGQ